MEKMVDTQLIDDETPLIIQVNTGVERSEAHMLNGCIKNYFIVKLYNKVKIIKHI